MEDLFRIGQITSAHGIRGDVKVYPVTSEPDRFLDLKEVLVAREGEEDHAVVYGVQKASFFKNLILLHLAGVDDRNQAETLAGFSLWVTRDQAIPLDEDEYYFKDLMGLSVIDEAGNDCGRVTDVLETGSNDVLVVEDAAGHEVLLPVIRECVLSMNVEAGIIRIHWMDGLRD